MPNRAPIIGVILAVVVAACSASVSTAHIGSVTIGAKQGFTTETTTFGPQDTIYAQATGDNLANAVTMQIQVIAENVTGQASNTPITSLDQSYNLSSDGTVSVNYSPPTAGWPTGTYKIVFTMMDNGTQRDQKSKEFTVSG